MPSSPPPRLNEAEKPLMRAQPSATAVLLVMAKPW